MTSTAGTELGRTSTGRHAHMPISSECDMNNSYTLSQTNPRNSNLYWVNCKLPLYIIL